MATTTTTTGAAHFSCDSWQRTLKRQENHSLRDRQNMHIVFYSCQNFATNKIGSKTMASCTLTSTFIAREGNIVHSISFIPDAAVICVYPYCNTVQQHIKHVIQLHIYIRNRIMHCMQWHMGRGETLACVFSWFPQFTPFSHAYGRDEKKKVHSNNKTMDP